MRKSYIVISKVNVMKDSNRMLGSFALPADLERAMAIGHIDLVKRVCTYAIHITGHSSDLVHHGLALWPKKMTTDVNEQNTQAIGLDGFNKK